MTDKCPSCEYNKLRAEMWREEAYRQAGTPLRGRKWQGLTRGDADSLRVRYTKNGVVQVASMLMEVEEMLRERNT